MITACEKCQIKHQLNLSAVKGPTAKYRCKNCNHLNRISNPEYTSSEDALQAFSNQPDKFDLIITDQTMPKMTGVELSKHLIRIRPDIPIVLCTGYSDLVDENIAKAIGIV